MDDNLRRVSGYLLGALMVLVVFPGAALLRRRSLLSMFLKPDQVPLELAAELRSAEPEPDSLYRAPAARTTDPADFDPGAPAGVTCEASGWQAQAPEDGGGRGSIANRLSYGGVLEAGVKQVLDVECALPREADAAPQFTFRLSPGLAGNDGGLFGLVSARGSARAVGPMALTAERDADGALSLRVDDGRQGWALLSLLRAGGELILQLHADPAAPLVKLPLPVGDEFEAAWQSLVAS